MSGGGRFQGNSNPNRQNMYGNQGYGNDPMDDDMYYGGGGNMGGGRANTRGGHSNNQGYYGGNTDNRRGGGYSKGGNAQNNPQGGGNYGHGQYGGSGHSPQQFSGQGGNMRGGMRNQPTPQRGGGGAGNMQMGGGHQGYYNQEGNQMNDGGMGYQKPQTHGNQRGGYGGNQRGGKQESAHPPGGQRMYNQMGAPAQNAPRGNMAPMQQNPNQRNMNMHQGGANPNYGPMDYPPQGAGARANPDPSYGAPIPQHGHAPMHGSQPRGNQMMGHPQRGGQQQGMGSPNMQGMVPPQQQAPQPPMAQNQDLSLSAQSEITMKRFNTLDRGTYFIDQANKSVNFIVDSESDILGWFDDYLINGYLLYGVVLKVTTLTSRIYLFIEKEHEIFQNHIHFEGDKVVRWKNLPKPEELHIITINSVEKVEIYDNSEDGFEGFVCYTVNEDSSLTFTNDSKSLQDWITLQRTFLLFEPTSIKKIFLDVLHNWLHQPESTKFQGKSVAAIVNPKIPGNAIQFSNGMKYIQNLEGEYCVGIIALQYGRYTLLSQTKENMENFSRLVEKILDIAEELDGYVMITNLRRQYDTSQQQKTILILPTDPTLKIVRYEGTMNFDKTKDKLSKVITM